MARVTKNKACKILRDGKIRNKRLSSRQRRMFGAICNK